MNQQMKLEALTAQADAAARQLEEMGALMCAFGEIEVLVSYEDLASQITSVVGGAFDGHLAAVRG